MGFWNRKKSSPPDPPNPYILFDLVDGVHLEITVGWPKDTDIKPFARLLALLNSGNIVEPQLDEIALYADMVSQPEKAAAICAALEGTKREVPTDRPLVPPSKVVINQMKNYS